MRNLIHYRDTYPSTRYTVTINTREHMFNIYDMDLRIISKVEECEIADRKITCSGNQALAEGTFRLIFKINSSTEKIEHRCIFGLRKIGGEWKIYLVEIPLDQEA